MLELKHLTIRHQNRMLCEDLSVEIEKGSVVVLKGKNGSGKSSLMHCLKGTEKADKGRVFLDGHDLHQLNKTERQQFLASTGMVFQTPSLRPLDSIIKTLDHQHADKIKRERMLKFLDFEHHGRKLIKDLSFAEQRRIDLGRSLVNQPKLVLWDEPFLGLDSSWRKKFLQALRELKDLGTTIIIATVNPQDLEELQVDKIIQL